MTTIIKNMLLLSVTMLVISSGCSVSPEQAPAENIPASESTPALPAAVQYLAAAPDNADDPDALSDFYATEAAGQSAVWRDFENKSAYIGIEKEGVTLKEFGVAHGDILMVTFLSSEPLAGDARPAVTIDAPLPAAALEEEYCQQLPEGYLTVYSAIMDRKIPYLSGGYHKSLVQVELLGRNYVFLYNWDWRQPELPEDDAQLREWLDEAAYLRTAYRDDAAHRLTPVAAVAEDPFRVVLEQVSMRKNEITAEGFIEVLSGIEDEYRLGVCLEANGEVFYAGSGKAGLTALGDNRDSSIISPEKDRYRIGWRWEMPFYYADLLSDSVFIRIELTNRATQEKLYYNFPYCLQ